MTQSPTRTRLVFAGALVLLLAVGAAFLPGVDLRYRLLEVLPGSNYRDYDLLIETVAAKHGVSPGLVKAVVWQESRFNPLATGAAGERGLMQVTEIAAKDWVAANQIEVFSPADLFDPKTNLEAGVWYLSRALRRYSDRDDPRPFALAEYNAGKSRVNRWKGETGGEPTAGEFQAGIDFPSTAAYIGNILSREEFYRRRGDFPKPAPVPATP